jgi:hypothetical protein
MRLVNFWLPTERLWRNAGRNDGRIQRENGKTRNWGELKIRNNENSNLGVWTMWRAVTWAKRTQHCCRGPSFVVQLCSYGSNVTVQLCSCGSIKSHTSNNYITLPLNQQSLSFQVLPDVSHFTASHKLHLCLVWKLKQRLVVLSLQCRSNFHTGIFLVTCLSIFYFRDLSDTNWLLCINISSPRWIQHILSIENGDALFPIGAFPSGSVHMSILIKIAILRHCSESESHIMCVDYCVCIERSGK